MSCTLRRSIRRPCAVEHVDVDEVRPRIDLAVGVDGAAAADDAAAALRRQLEPDLVRVGRALREVVADLQGPHDRFEQIGLRPASATGLGAQRRGNRPSIVPPVFSANRSTRATPVRND